MKTLKQLIRRYMTLITSILITFTLLIIIYIQVENEQRQAYEYATRTFIQIEQVLDENQQELYESTEEYRQTCLHNAEAIAYIIQDDPSVLESVDALKEIARFIEVDEIHIFDTSGRIYAGTHPEYYDFTFDSGEQMMFFKPMLSDKSLKLVQDITPNTAEAKLMQYSALWSSNGEFIVQVGMEPVKVMKITEKNELSSLFSLLRVNPGAGYYAIDVQSGEIIGSTDSSCVGSHLEDIGLTDGIPALGKGFHAVINGIHSHCVFRKMGSNYIGRVISSRQLYRRIPSTTAVLALSLIAIACALAHAMIRYLDRYVVSGIHNVNEKLSSIAKGNLDEVIDIQSSVELSELSSYINRMKNSLLDNNRKMSYVLSKTNMYIGVYEYNEHMPQVRFTEYIPRIFALDETAVKSLSFDHTAFKEYIERLRQHPVDDEPGVFESDGHYIKLEELNDNNEIFGVAIDVTDEIRKRRQMKAERDYDLLTGLYNRRGLELQLTSLFHDPEKLGLSVLVMIDADNLKTINDTYGHDLGDNYLRAIADLIRNFGSPKNISARLGGDEFVLFLYGYGTQDALTDSVNQLQYMQNSSTAQLNEQLSVSLQFSFGYSLTRQDADYEDLLREADRKMYENKRARKEKHV